MFADEPGKQVRSAIKLKNTSKSHTAFKVTETCTCIIHRAEKVDFLLTLFSSNISKSLLCFSSKQLHRRAVTCVLLVAFWLQGRAPLLLVMSFFFFCGNQNVVFALTSCYMRPLIPFVS